MNRFLVESAYYSELLATLAAIVACLLYLRVAAVSSQRIGNLGICLALLVMSAVDCGLNFAELARFHVPFDLDMVEDTFDFLLLGVWWIFFYDCCQTITARKLHFQSELLDSVKESVVAADLEGRVTFWGKGAEQLYGFSQEQTLGESITFIVPPQDNQAERERMRETLRTGSWQGQYQQRRHDGSLFWADTRLSLIRDGWGNPTGFIGIDRDVTEQRANEEQREALIADLEQKNAELERFTYTVSHDLKSPLITIKGFLGFLEKDLDESNFEALRQDLAEISAATDKMHELLEELLELSRVGRLTKPCEVVEIARVVREAVDLISNQINASNATIEVATDLPVVIGDPVRLREVFQNLLENAVKFSQDQPQAVVRVGTCRQQSERVIYVEDNGIGIDPRYADKIFDLFEQLDPALPGTGIGLAIVKRIMEVHGGRIWVESGDGEQGGARFCLTLPEHQPASHQIA